MDSTDTEETQTCLVCGELKPLSDFRPVDLRASKAHCRSCMKRRVCWICKRAQFVRKFSLDARHPETGERICDECCVPYHCESCGQDRPMWQFPPREDGLGILRPVCLLCVEGYPRARCAECRKLKVRSQFTHNPNPHLRMPAICLKCMGKRRARVERRELEEIRAQDAERAHEDMASRERQNKQRRQAAMLKSLNKPVVQDKPGTLSADLGFSPREITEVRTRIGRVQGDKCAICDDEFTSENPPHLDHAHGTQKVRGVLCRRCNHGLGCFRDRPELLEKAGAYLGHHV